MTKIKNIRVFDEYDCKYEVNEIDIDKGEGVMQLYINAPKLYLSEELNKIAVVTREIEDMVMNVLSIDGLPIHQVKYFEDSGIIVLRFDRVITTIRIAELCHIDERAVTPFDRGLCYINCDRAVDMGVVNYE